MMPSPSFAHLASLSDDTGIFEHADRTHQRVEHGYCTDDNARLLVVTCREPDPSPLVSQLARRAARFLADAQGVDGRYRNRLSAAQRWQDRPSVGDWWGRSLWGLGTAVARSPIGWLRQDSLVRFERAARCRSPWLRAMAFAGLGAAEVLTVQAENRAARDLAAAVADVMRSTRRCLSWPWPEERLWYANAVLPESMIAVGVALDADDMVRDGLELLAWLLDRETWQGHLSVTPHGGKSLGDPQPAFDQQPIEVAALADACARAALVTSEARWVRGVADAVGWFLGDNDAHAVMWDATTGGGFDGLTPNGPNVNQGAESTLALVSTLQHARYLVAVP